MDDLLLVFKVQRSDNIVMNLDICTKVLLCDYTWKLSQTRSELDPNSTRTQPELEPNSTQPKFITIPDGKSCFFQPTFIKGSTQEKVICEKAEAYFSGVRSSI